MSENLNFVQSESSQHRDELRTQRRHQREKVEWMRVCVTPVTPSKDGISLTNKTTRKCIRCYAPTEAGAQKCFRCRKIAREANQKSENCCYVTSACLDDLQFSRDSPEMIAMKTLTKSHILKSFGGRRDYILYGRIAPSIVKAIRAREDYKQIWIQVYEKLRDITALVNSRDYSAGYKEYKILVRGLEKQFVSG